MAGIWDIFTLVVVQGIEGLSQNLCSPKYLSLLATPFTPLDDTQCVTKFLKFYCALSMQCQKLETCVWSLLHDLYTETHIVS